jgi:hypothetical protein
MSLSRTCSVWLDDWIRSSISLCSSDRFGIGQGLGHADDAVQGRADLVAHIGQELALGAVGLLGRIAGVGQGAASRFSSVMSVQMVTVPPAAVRRSETRSQRSPVTCCSTVVEETVRVAIRSAIQSSSRPWPSE